MTDLLSESDDSISLMAYLKAMFPNEWSNFKERMKVGVCGWVCVGGGEGLQAGASLLSRSVVRACCRTCDAACVCND